MEGQPQLLSDKDKQHVCTHPTLPTATLGRQPLPPIIRFSNRVQFTDKRAISQFIDGVLVATSTSVPYVILDFQHTTAMESSIASFLAQQAVRLAVRSTHLIVTGASRGSEIEVRLAHGGLGCDWNLANSIEEVPDHTRNERKEKGTVLYRSFDSIEAFVRGCPSSETCYGRSCAGRARGEAGLHMNTILERLARDFPDMARYGITLGRFALGHSILCQRYPIRSAFVVLSGGVVIQGPHDLPSEKSAQQPFRSMCLAAFAYSHQWLQLIARGRGQQKEASRRILLPGDLYRDALEYTCAHADSTICWILEVDACNVQGVERLEQIATACQGIIKT